MIASVPKTLAFTYPQVLRILAEELVNLPPKYFQLLTFIAARTLRFGKTSERISLTHFLDGIETDSGWIQRPVGLGKNAVSSGLLELETAGIIDVIKCRNNVKKMGINLTVLAEGVDEMASRLRVGKATKAKNTTEDSQESYPSVSHETGDQYPQKRETSIPKSGRPNISSRSKDLRINNGATALVEILESVKEKSKINTQRKIDKLPVHKLGLKIFSTYVKDNYPTLKSISPTPSAIRNMRLATDGLNRETVTAFATHVTTNWESIIIQQLSYLHKKDANLHVAPCVNTFGIMAAKFLEAYNRQIISGDNDSTVRVRNKPSLSLVPQRQDEEKEIMPKTVRRVQTKAERNKSLGIPTEKVESKKKDAIEDTFDMQVRKLMREEGITDYEEAADIIAYRD